MRIIAGEWKGIRLEAPQGDVARPTTDRVKESMFSLMGISWTGGVVLDLFSGSGALGLEALSRGADHAILADKSEKSIRAIRENVSRCKAEPYCTVIRGDYSRAIEQARTRAEPVSWIFVDPPYHLNMWAKVLDDIEHAGILVAGGVVCEHPKNQVLPLSTRHFQLKKSKQYGDIAITIYEQKTRMEELP